MVGTSTHGDAGQRTAASHDAGDPWRTSEAACTWTEPDSERPQAPRSRSHGILNTDYVSEQFYVRSTIGQEAQRGPMCPLGASSLLPL